MFGAPTAQPLSSRGAQPLNPCGAPSPRAPHTPTLRMPQGHPPVRTRPETTVLSRTRVRTLLKQGAGLELKPPLPHPWPSLKTGPPGSLRETKGFPPRTCPRVAVSAEAADREGHPSPPPVKWPARRPPAAARSSRAASPKPPAVEGPRRATVRTGRGAPPEGVGAVGEVARAVTAVPPRAQGDAEEHQVGHQGHGQQHDLQLQAHPQEDRTGDEGQDAAAGVILRGRGAVTPPSPRAAAWAGVPGGRGALRGRGAVTPPAQPASSPEKWRSRQACCRVSSWDTQASTGCPPCLGQVSPRPRPKQALWALLPAPLLGEAGLCPSTLEAQALGIGGGRVRPGTRTWRSSHGVPSPPRRALGLLSFPAGGPRAGEGNSGCGEDGSCEGAQGPRDLPGPSGRAELEGPASRGSCQAQLWPTPHGAIGFTVGRVQQTDATPDRARGRRGAGRMSPVSPGDAEGGSPRARSGGTWRRGAPGSRRLTTALPEPRA